MITKAIISSAVMFALSMFMNVQAEDLYFSASDPGYAYWDDVSGWKIYNTGGQLYGQLPAEDDNAFVNAATLAAEDGKALCVTSGVSAVCNTLATGDSYYDGTAYFRLEGGSVTCNTHFVTSRSYPGLSVLESGNVYVGDHCYIGSSYDYDNDVGSSGTLTNNGATVSCYILMMANYTNQLSPSVLVQNGGKISTRYRWYVGEHGEAMMEVNGGSIYSASEFSVGLLSTGKGTLTLNGGSITGNSFSCIGKYGEGSAVLNTGTLYSAGNLYVGFKTGSNGTITNNGSAVSVGWTAVMGYQTGTYGKMVHNGGSLYAYAFLLIGRDGGIGEFEADAPFHTDIMVVGSGLAPGDPGTGTVTIAENVVGTIDEYLRVNNGDLFMRGGEIHLQNVGNLNTNLYVRTGEDRRGQIRGWGAFTNVNEDIILRMINNGQIIADGEGVERDLNLNMIAVVNNEIPNGPTGTNGWYAVNKGRVLFPRSYDTGGINCWGDFYGKTVPEMVNSVAFEFSDSQTHRYVRGGFCASDRSDIPAGLPENLRPIGVWCMGAFSEKLSMEKAWVSTVSLDFRYDHTKVLPTDCKLRLYRYEDTGWVKVGECDPNNSDSLISTDNALSGVSTGDYNIGWFAVMAVEMNGTVIMLQ
ncbi:MAG: hypothetical protein R6V06_03090 [Kiritimatiellia bacterium]